MADFSELPHGVLVHIFSGLALPNPDSVGDLCAAASVCPSWRDAAKEPGLWRVLVVDEAPLNERLTGRRLRNLVARSHNTLSWLTLKDCPLLNDAVLVLPLHQQPCLVYVDVRGCALVTRPSLAYALCDSEDFQGVVEQLSDPCHSAEDAQRCCVALFTLLQTKEEEEEATLAEAQAAGVLDALLRCAALHAAHAGVQAACCWALAEYIYVAKDTGVVSYPSVFQAAVAALKAHPLDVEVQGSTLIALRIACCYGLDGTPAVPALLDAIPPVLAAMRAFPTDLDVQHAGCDSLVKMCNMDGSVPEAVATAGAMGLFIKALNLDLSHSQPTNDTCISAADAIRAIALSASALPQASAGIDAVVRALRRHEENSEFAEAACMTLASICTAPPRARKPSRQAQRMRSWRRLRTTATTKLSKPLPMRRSRTRRHEPGHQSVSRKERAALKTTSFDARGHCSQSKFAAHAP